MFFLLDYKKQIQKEKLYMAKIGKGAEAEKTDPILSAEQKKLQVVLSRQINQFSQFSHNQQYVYYLKEISAEARNPKGLIPLLRSLIIIHNDANEKNNELLTRSIVKVFNALHKYYHSPESKQFLGDSGYDYASAVMDVFVRATGQGQLR